MANQDAITIPFELPRDEAAALSQFVKRVDYDTCTQPRFASVTTTYNGRIEEAAKRGRTNAALSAFAGAAQGPRGACVAAPARGHRPCRPQDRTGRFERQGEAARP